MQLHSEIPAVCKNEECEHFKAFELYDEDEVIQGKRDYVICFDCKQRIYLD